MRHPLGVVQQTSVTLQDRSRPHEVIERVRPKLRNIRKVNQASGAVLGTDHQYLNVQKGTAIWLLAAQIIDYSPQKDD